MNINLLKNIIETTSSRMSDIVIESDVHLLQFRNAKEFYYLNDVKGLRDAKSYFRRCGSDFKYAGICEDIVNARCLIREKYNNLQNRMIPTSEYEWSSKYRLSEDQVLILFMVELLTVEAVCHSLAAEYKLCVEKYRKARDLAMQVGLKKKASVLNYNATHFSGYFEPSQARISLLSDTIKFAEGVGDHASLISAIAGLAQEYEYLDCYNLAYEECAKALVWANQHCFGSLEFCGLLLQIARLGALSGRAEIARRHLNLVESFAFSELKDRVVSVRALLQRTEIDAYI